MNSNTPKCGTCDKDMSLELLIWDGYRLPMKTWVCKSEGCFDYCFLADNEKTPFDAIENEKNFQRAKWSNGTISLGGYLILIQGELDEAMQAWRKNRGNEDCLREVLQVATLAVRAMEEHGIVEREECVGE